MTATLAASAAVLGAAGLLGTHPPNATDALRAPETKTVVQGIAFHDSAQAAFRQAKSEGKPVLVLRIFGDLDDAYC